MNPVSYNASRPYTPEQWRGIQRIVGAAPDGNPGPATATAVAAWQRAHGLDPDGKVGPATLRALDLASATPPSPPATSPARLESIGVWYDGDAGRGVAEAARMLRAMGVREVCVMLTRVPGGMRRNGIATPRDVPVWSRSLASVAVLGDALRRYGLRVSADVWPSPRVRHVELIAAELPEYLDALGTRDVELDAEGNWRAQHVRGFESLQEAADALISRLRPLTRELSLTSYPLHGEFSAGATLARQVDLLWPQAYSWHAPDDHDREPGQVHGPGRMQALGWRRATSVLPPAQVALGLAAFRQGFPGMTVYEAMNLAVVTGLGLGCGRFRYWSSKHVLAESAHATQVRAFIRALAGAYGC